MASGKRRATYAAYAVVAIAVVVVAYFALASLSAPTEYTTFSDSAAMAELFIRSAPTYRFDGASLSFVNATQCGQNCWSLNYDFGSLYPGYGDRTNMTGVSQPTIHTETIVIRNGEIASATIDGAWDELTQARV